VEKAIELYFDRLDEMVADKRIDDLKSRKTSAITPEEILKSGYRCRRSLLTSGGKGVFLIGHRGKRDDRRKDSATKRRQLHQQ